MKAKTFEEKVEKLMKVLDPATQAMMEATEHLGPFHQDKNMDTLYRFFRIHGYDEQAAQMAAYKLKSLNP